MSRLVLVSALALSLAAVPVRARACAPCGAGDATLTGVGTATPYAGRTQVWLLGRYLDQRVGDAEITELRTTLGLAVAPTTWLSLSVTLPLVYRDVGHPNLVRESGAGLGDAELRARALVWSERHADPSHTLFVEVGTRVPTTTRLSVREAPLSFEAQPGTGSIDPLVALRWNVLGAELSSFASVSAFFPTQGHGGYRAGVGGLASWIGQWQPLFELAFQLGAELRVEDRARIDEAPIDHGGGVSTFMVVGAAVRPVDAVSIVASVRVPLAQSLAGSSRDGAIAELGVILDAN